MGTKAEADESPVEITALLRRLASGDQSGAETLFRLLYAELKRLAGARLHAERDGHTLQPTALVHEAYIRLVNCRGIEWQSRAHFFAVAAQAMRRILADYARSRNAIKRGGLQGPALELDERVDVAEGQSPLIEALDEALDRLSEQNPRQARIVEMRFFGGLTEEEIAEIEGLSSRTVKREWNKARAWLRGELS